MNFENIIQDLINKNWSLNLNFLDHNFCEKLINDFRSVQLKDARVGKGINRELHSEIRSDKICWLDPETATPAQLQYLNKMYELQLIINRELYLGLKEFECHLALYQKGNFYSKHSDQFKGNNGRQISTISYLNTPSSGGELVIYKKENSNEIDTIIKPQAGMFICFLSDELYHEVKPTEENRYSITGWFKNEIAI